jgi:uncharacterized membrane protein YraQ (UPF0718 family)
MGSCCDSDSKPKPPPPPKATMPSCCDDGSETKSNPSGHSGHSHDHDGHGHSHSKRKFDPLLHGCGLFIATSYLAHLFYFSSQKDHNWLAHLSMSVFEQMNMMWWGILLGVIFAGLLGLIPREIVQSAIGRPGSFKGVLRATAAGVLFDLCSHGILVLGAKLYERGASLGQMMAFLIASPWNSFSLTFILIGLIGLKWTLVFIAMSAVIALVSGFIFDLAVSKGFLPSNPASVQNAKEFSFSESITGIKKEYASRKNPIRETLILGMKDSKMILRWLFLGVTIASFIGTFVSTEFLQNYFGASLIGVLLTLVAATVIEVCSEGSTPIAAQIFNKAGAPGNAFLFMMAGVSTDYTEIAIIRERTKSWKIALALPLITLPQIIILALIMNHFR